MPKKKTKPRPKTVVHRPLAADVHETEIPPGPPPTAIIVSRYNASITERLLAGALEVYEERFGSREGVAIIDAPGAFEIPVLAAVACDCQLFDAVVALGCIVRGQTSHHEHLASAVTNQLAALSTDATMPIGLGVLTCDTIEQALERAGGPGGNKGREAMAAALDTLDSIAEIAIAADSGDPSEIRRTLTRTIAKLGLTEST